MARPIKKGLDYYSLDSDFLRDMKVRKVMRAQGAAAIAVLIDLLGNIYGDEGYYMLWDEDARFLVADDVGVKESLVQAIVDKAVKVGLFDSALYAGQQILTSHGIQKRYKQAAVQKKDSTIKPELNLLQDEQRDDNEVSKPGNPMETPVSMPESTQSKVKESKGYKSKEEETTTKDLSELLLYIHTAYANGSIPELTEDERALWRGYEQPAIDYYASHIGEVTLSVRNNIDRWYRQLDKDCVAKALQIAAGAGKEWSYAAGVLNNWYQAGVRSYDDVTPELLGNSLGVLDT